MASINESYLQIVPYVDPVEAFLDYNSRPEGCGQSFVGYQKFAPEGNSSMASDACGCNRACHQKGKELQLLPLLDTLERGNRPIRQSRLLPTQPKVVMKRKKRVKVTPEDEALMESVTQVIGWDPRRQDKTRANELCKKLDISRAYYLQWMRDMKLIKDYEREAARIEAERVAKTERAARAANEAAGSLLMLCNS